MTIDKNKTNRKLKPAHVIRSGNVVANLKVHQTNTGFQYLGVELLREFKSMNTGKVQKGSSFFTSDEQDLVNVVKKAMAYIQSSQAREADEVPDPLSTS